MIITIILIILIILLISLICIQNRDNFTINVNVNQSKYLPFKANGLFASKDFKKGETIEVCPVLKIDSKINNNIINDYIFKSNNDNKHNLLAMGYCGLINHSKNDINVKWYVSKNNKTIRFYCIKNIKKGDELLTNYGENYWKHRKDLHK